MGVAVFAEVDLRETGGLDADRERSSGANGASVDQNGGLGLLEVLPVVVPGDDQQWLPGFGLEAVQQRVRKTVLVDESDVRPLREPSNQATKSAAASTGRMRAA